MICTVVEGDPFPGLVVGFTAEDVAANDGVLPQIDLPELMMITNTHRPPVILQIIYAETQEELEANMKAMFDPEIDDLQLLGSPGDTLEEVHERAVEFTKKHERLAAAGIDDDTRQQNIAASHAIRIADPRLN